MASTITSSGDKPLREMPLVQAELEEITSALEGFKAEVALLARAEAKNLGNPSEETQASKCHRV